MWLLFVRAQLSRAYFCSGVSIGAQAVDSHAPNKPAAREKEEYENYSKFTMTH
jgi:hypothetical protein